MLDTPINKVTASTLFWVRLNINSKLWWWDSKDQLLPSVFLARSLWCRKSLDKNDRDQVYRARDTEHPTQPLVFTKTAGRHNLVEVIVIEGLPLMPPPPPSEQSLLLSSWGEEGLCLNCVKPFESPHAQTLLSNWFFECEHSFIDKPTVITEPVVPSARLLGIGSKLYLSNMQRYSPKSSQRKKGSAVMEETASSPVNPFSLRSDQHQ